MRFSLATMFAVITVVAFLFALWQSNAASLFVMGPIVAMILAVWAETNFGA